MPMNLDPRNAIPVLELAPNLAVSEIFNRLTTSGHVEIRLFDHVRNRGFQN